MEIRMEGREAHCATLRYKDLRPGEAFVFVGLIPEILRMKTSTGHVMLDDGRQYEGAKFTNDPVSRANAHVVWTP